MPDIMHDFQIAAPIERVFAAVTNPAGLDEWWTKSCAGTPSLGNQSALGLARVTTKRIPMRNASMYRTGGLAIAAACLALSACVPVRTSVGGEDATNAVSERGTLAHIYYWRAKPGKLAEYTKYITELAEPIDYEAKRAGAFLSVTTYVSVDTANTWTHMRVFILRDSAQLNALAAALGSAGLRLEPDSVKRRVRGEYSATLRDRVGDQVVSLLPAR